MRLPTDQLWAIEPSAFQAMLGMLAGHAAAFQDAPRRREAPRIRRIAQAAIIEIVGVLTKSGSFWFGTSYLDIRAQLVEALHDPQVREIILLIDSPGGSSDGCADTADDIAAANRVKTVTAFASDWCTSAAYHLASQAGRIFASPSATCGSVGTYSVVYDWSAALDRAGVKAHVFASGRYKAAGVFGAPLTPDQADSLQRYINAHQALFESHVARTRRLNPKQLDAVFNAELFVGAAAVQAGLVDKLARFNLHEVAATAARYEAQSRARAAEQAHAADSARRAAFNRSLSRS